MYVLFFSLVSCGGGSGRQANEISADDEASVAPPAPPAPIEEDSQIAPLLVEKPWGIFSLDSAQGTFRDANIREYPFVRGYAWRQSWSDFELSDGNYNFASLDHIVSELVQRDLKLSLLLFTTAPSHIISEDDVDVWTDNGESKPSPWDPDLHERFDRFMEALANYPLPDPAAGGAAVPFNQHSVLEVMHPGIPGLPRGSLRDGAATRVSQVPGYSRENLFTAIDAAMSSFTNHFPNQSHLVSLWNISDSMAEPALWEAARDRVLNYPNTGFWQDNLSASRPCEDCEPVTGRPVLEGLGQPLIPEPGGFSGFQMLSSWNAPFGTNHAENVAHATPFDGMNWALESYESLYFEVYIADLDHTDWHEGFDEWAALLEQAGTAD
jgi:hypothetical protein